MALSKAGLKEKAKEKAKEKEKAGEAEGEGREKVEVVADAVEDETLAPAIVQPVLTRYELALRFENGLISRMHR